MNNNKIHNPNRIKTNHGLLYDCEFQPNCYSSQHFGVQQFSNMGFLDQESSQLQNLSPEKPSSTIVSRFESPVSAFYATEICMKFSQYESHSSSGLSSFENYEFKNSIDPSIQTEPNNEFRTSLQPIVKPSQLCSYQYYNRSCEKLNSNIQNIKTFQHQSNNPNGGSFASIQSHYPITFNEYEDNLGSYYFLGSLTHKCFSTQQKKQLSPRHGSVCSVNSASSGQVILSRKTRIRWTQDLHEKFVECINRLGGDEKATPKAILKLMDSEGLTIFHVKSHLQKYRIAKYLPNPRGGNSEKRCNATIPPQQLDVKDGLQIKEALQLQLDVQKRLHEQLEIQRNLQVRIEEQGKQLQMMIDMQQKSNNSFFKTQPLSTTLSYDDVPSISLDDDVDQISTAADSWNT